MSETFFQIETRGEIEGERKREEREREKEKRERHKRERDRQKGLACACSYPARVYECGLTPDHDTSVMMRSWCAHIFPGYLE